MKINKLHINQFAGITDFDADFKDGLNMVVGENESGKSTIVEFIYQSLFNNKPIPKGGDRFIGIQEDGDKATYYAGILEVEKDAQIHKLDKKWNDKSLSFIMQTNGGIKTDDVKDNIEKLKKLLPYKEGVYRELIFQTQKSDSKLLAALLTDNEEQKLQSDITSTFADAVAVAGGALPIKQMKDLVNEQVETLQEKWDNSTNMPQAEIMSKYKDRMPASKIKDSVTEGWYLKDLTEKKLTAAKKLEKSYEDALKKREELKEEIEIKKNSLKEIEDNFVSIHSQELATINSEKLNKMTTDKLNWEKLLENKKSYDRLSEEFNKAISLDRFDKIDSKKKEYDEASAAFNKLKEIDNTVISGAEKLENDISKNTAELNSLNLELRINDINYDKVTIRSLVNDSIISTDKKVLEIKEAVNISVPGMLDVDILPQGVDVDSIRNNIKSSKQKISDLFNDYKVSDIDELKNLLNQYLEEKNKLSDLKEKYDELLGEDDYDILKNNCESYKEVRSLNDVDGDVNRLTDGQSLEIYGAILKDDLQEYESKYTSLSDLDKSISELTQQINELNKKITVIPKSLLGVEDINAYKNKIEDELRVLEQEKEVADDNYAQINIRLENDPSVEELELELRKWSKYFDDILAEYKSWLKIKEKLDSYVVSGDRTAEIEKRFKDYLAILTDKRIRLDGFDRDLNMSLASKNYMLKNEYLSEGTKDTIAFAFRLAILDSLFPDGGGLLVLDDPFVDMDPKRKEKACELVNEFARNNNQVIFATCTPDYDKLLKVDNTINM